MLSNSPFGLFVLGIFVFLCLCWFSSSLFFFFILLLIIILIIIIVVVVAVAFTCVVRVGKPQSLAVRRWENAPLFDYAGCVAITASC